MLLKTGSFFKHISQCAICRVEIWLTDEKLVFSCNELGYSLLQLALCHLVVKRNERETKSCSKIHLFPLSNVTSRCFINIFVTVGFQLLIEQFLCKSQHHISFTKVHNFKILCTVKYWLIREWNNNISIPKYSVEKIVTKTYLTKTETLQKVKINKLKKNTL